MDVENHPWTKAIRAARRHPPQQDGTTPLSGDVLTSLVQGAMTGVLSDVLVTHKTVSYRVDLSPGNTARIDIPAEMSAAQANFIRAAMEWMIGESVARAEAEAAKKQALDKALADCPSLPEPPK